MQSSLFFKVVILLGFKPNAEFEEIRGQFWYLF